jgi:hypothetical protein
MKAQVRDGSRSVTRWTVRSKLHDRTRTEPSQEVEADTESTGVLQLQRYILYVQTAAGRTGEPPALKKRDAVHHGWRTRNLRSQGWRTTSAACRRARNLANSNADAVTIAA